MASLIETAVSTSVDVPSIDINGHSKSTSSSKAAKTSPAESLTTKTPGRSVRSKYRHIAAYHSELRTSCLSRDSTVNPSFIGFRNLMVIVLIVMNLRLIVENFMKYGVLICIKCHDYRRNDVFLGSILFALVPCHLFVAYIIELAAAQQAKGAVGRTKKSHDQAAESEKERRAFQSTWRLIAFAHTVNATLCLVVTNFVVYYYIHHPGIGTICEFHAIIVWLKNCSYAFTNRDLRHSMLHPSEQSKIPEIYSTCPYPKNVTVGNLTYFWLAPTLVYQPVYPRTPRIRWSFVGKRLVEFVVLSVFIWLTSAQYAAPVLRNSLEKIAVLDFTSIVERIMKLSTISLVIWLAGFFALFQSFLNALAEVMRFGDREFYSDWWNSWSVGMYWRSWNKPVYLFMKRHIFSPLVGRGWSPFAASAMVFLFSAILHELLVGIPTHNLIGVAFAGMLLQLPLITVTLPLEKRDDPTTRIIGNSVFWVSFCLVGQPLGALLYFFAWQAKYGSVSKLEN
ncbi:putative diacylglycerol O-acyltransferase [Talaromyces proteolyticus]|uniref:O-acyltransferase n=1 Tax=Talaromyces proteolyticus TaxID=1131652 RepID=A0AAD4KM72_9EURO|nr:putative diacylglycerol O-acyltransferase [Talaromyces proteolyticus]KAH8695997.1 putative diacylglycerol O-acyltransferase [Talaromyces proteolyticus]